MTVDYYYYYYLKPPYLNYFNYLSIPLQLQKNPFVSKQLLKSVGQVFYLYYTHKHSQLFANNWLTRCQSGALHPFHLLLARLQLYQVDFLKLHVVRESFDVNFKDFGVKKLYLGFKLFGYRKLLIGKPGPTGQIGMQVKYQLMDSCCFGFGHLLFGLATKLALVILPFVFIFLILIGSF